MTTRFLAEHIKASGSRDRIIAIDTFSSFVESDLRYEIEHRGKSRAALNAFSYNDFDIWKRNFRAFDCVRPMQADCAAVDYAALAPVKLALLDVDLYLPTKNVLPRLYDALIADGIILIDDVKVNETWDGAHQAYYEFCTERGIEPKVIGNKCGVIHKG